MKKIFDTPEIELLYFDEIDAEGTSNTPNPSPTADAQNAASDDSVTSIHVTDINTSGMDWTPTN